MDRIEGAYEEYESYETVYQSVQYSDASTVCSNLGKTLPVVNSAGDVARVSQYTSTWFGNTCSSNTYWGSSYLSNESANSASNNGNWQPGEPNSNCHEGCVEVYSSGYWNDSSCSNYKYV